MKIDKEVLIEGLKGYFPEEKILASIVRFNEGSLFGKIEEVSYIAKVCVFVVEKMAKDAKEAVPGSEKAKAIVEWLDDIFKFNLFIELIDGKLAKALVDSTIRYYNETFGHDWLNHLIKEGEE